ncbi:MAG: 1-acyl-sn-glycerol-3-phosphate acyltransferase [Bacteroidales bacterium]|nr:1-acyl-sn-glycerol-3-phosphate acyltransferase [Bacteroidales bacterium]
MIDFTGIEKWSIWYETYYIYIGFIHNNFFYRQHEIYGVENLPKKPFLIVSNHQNGLLDPLSLVFGLKDIRIVFIARGDLFKKDLVARGLKEARILPAFRVRDTGKENLGDNDKIFNISADLLANGHIVGLFPEAALQYDRSIGTFQKGFARIAFMYEERVNFEKDLQIVPISNYYDNFSSVGHSVVNVIGKPFTFSEFYDLYKEHPEAAYRQLALKSMENTEPLMLNMCDRENFEQLDYLRGINYYNLRKTGKCGKKAIDRMNADKRLVAKMKAFKESNPESFEVLLGNISTYKELLQKLNLHDWIIGRKYNIAEMLLKSILTVFVLVPVYVLLCVFCWLPYKVTGMMFGSAKDKRMISSLRFGAGSLIIYPFWSVLLFGLSFIIPWPWWCSVIFFFVSLFLVPFLSRYFNLARRHFVKFHFNWQYYFKYGKDKDLAEAIELKSKIIEEIDKQ